jgi:uncharacterized protein YutD
MKPITFIFMAMLAISCGKKSGDAEKKQSDADLINRTIRDNNPEDYRSVPEMISLSAYNGNLDSTWVLNKYDFLARRDSAIYDWRYFDELYKTIPDKNSYITQNFGYAIIISKGLLKVQGQEAEDKIMYYTDQLVKTEYHGYGVLYFALKRLAESKVNSNFITQQLSLILSYASQDAKAQMLLKEDINKAPEEMRKRMGRSKFNAEFIAKLQEMQNTMAKR